jgi:hypothetical protein
MASGHVNRTNRPNTWLHRPATQREDFPCQLGAVHTWQIVLQKSKVAGLRFFRENTKREATADSYGLIRVTEVAYEFNTRR